MFAVISIVFLIVFFSAYFSADFSLRLLYSFTSPLYTVPKNLSPKNWVNSFAPMENTSSSTKAEYPEPLEEEQKEEEEEEETTGLGDRIDQERELVLGRQKESIESLRNGVSHMTDPELHFALQSNRDFNRFVQTAFEILAMEQIRRNKSLTQTELQSDSDDAASSCSSSSTMANAAGIDNMDHEKSGDEDASHPE